jgi:hypothetical protein
MADSRDTPKIELPEVMIAMDVVDTLRHQRSLVERELQSEDREQALIEKLRRIYADQGIEVSDAVIAEGVRAMREERFAYSPPKTGWRVSLAHVYIDRGRWAKRLLIGLAALVGIWGAYQYIYVAPAERARTRTARELKTNLENQTARMAELKQAIVTTSGELEAVRGSAPANIAPQINRSTQKARQALAAASRQLEAAEKLPAVMSVGNDRLEETASSVQKRLITRKGLLNKVESDLRTARGAVASIQALRSGFSELRDLRAQALAESKDPDAARTIESLYEEAYDSILSGGTESAQKARQALKNTHDIIKQEYTLQIVSRPGTPSGVWRYPVDRQSARNYYLIVEAIAPSGRPLKLPITSEEDGTTRMMTAWGLRVDASVFEKVRRDKEADGMVNRKRVGYKKRGYLDPDYEIPTTGGMITEW